MPLPTKSEAQRDLEDLFAQAPSVIERAWRHSLRVLSEYPMTRKRTRANIMWDLATGYLEELLGEHSAIVIKKCGQTCYFHVHQKWIVRFKKGDSAGYSRNYPTQSALQLHDPRLPLDGMPPAHLLELQYVLNHTESEIAVIQLVFRNGDRVEWSLPLNGGQRAIDLEAAKPEAPVTPVAVRVKTTAKETREKSGDGES